MNMLDHSERWRPMGARDVKPIDQFPIYELGAAMQDLRSVCAREGASRMDQLIALWQASSCLTGLLSGTYLEVSYCRAATEELLRAVRDTLSLYEKDDEHFDLESPGLPSARLFKVRSKLDIFQHQLSGELKKQAAYAVPNQGIFNTEHLVDKADQHIHESVRDLLPPFALSEYRKAGRCLAFGLYSASGYHSARAVESVTRAYYRHVFGHAPKKADAGLGLMASHLNDALEKKSECAHEHAPNENTVRHLRDFARLDRNPVIHPTQELDLLEIDALTMFNSALGVMQEMAKELRRSRSSSTILTGVWDQTSSDVEPSA